MLEKKNRICLDKEFDRAFKTGQSFYANILGLKVVPNGLFETRLGLLVGLKVSKKAVIRNKVKRQIRSIIRAELDKIVGSYDIVVIVLPPITGKNFKEIKEVLLSGLKKLHLYK